MTVLEFSGGESARLTEALIDNGVTDLLYSYYWIQSMGRGGWIRKLKERNPQLNITLDSGAFTYSQKIGDERLPPPRLFFRRYKEYIADNLDVFGKVMEFDCDDPDVDVSSDEVADWTEELLDTFPNTRITPVFHAWRGVEEWDRYLKDPRVKSLAIGRSPPMDGLVSVYIDQAHRVGKTVHGLAWTKYNTSLPFLPFDSIDSSTWVSGQKYGNFYIYRNNKILNLTLRNRGALRIRGERAYIEARGCDPDLIFKGDKWELLTCNIRTWILIAKKLEILRKKQHRVLTEEKPVKQVAAWPQPRNSSFDLESFLLAEKS